MSAPERLPFEADGGPAMAARYAVYYAPSPDSLLHRLGSSWLGRDAYGGGIETSDFAALIEEPTREPRRYGFHGTLKAPIALNDGVSLDDLLSEADRQAGGITPFAIELKLALIKGFLALVPAASSPELAALAARCVETFDRFRKPASEADLARRRAAGLTERQEINLATWGYPYVFEDFQFHLTLTRRLSPAEIDVILPLAERHFAPVTGKPLVIDALTIFAEPAPGAEFIVHHRAPFRAASQVHPS